MNQDQKDKIIKSVYYNDQGYKSQYQTYIDANSKEPSIRLKDVRDWFTRKVERTRKEGRGWNSFVAQGPFQEYQFDVMFITEKQLPNQEYPFGVAVIDVFSKYATMIPIKRRRHEEIMGALLKSFPVIGKQPEVVMSDPESAMFNREVDEAFDEMGIQYIRTQSRANFVERFIRTFRGLLNRRVEEKQRQLELRLRTKTSPTIQWTDYVDDILKVYNTSVHSSIGMTPTGARKKENTLSAKIEMEMKARRVRKYPEINVGDTVRVLRKKILGDKEFVGAFRPGRHKVESISTNFGQKFYKLDDRREYIRADIVKVNS